jgi:hypothetical protein
MENSIRTVAQEGSSFTTPGNLRTFALVGYVCGFGNSIKVCGCKKHSTSMGKQKH